MADAQPKARERIDAKSDEDIRYWAKALGVTGVQIIDAVAKVGPNAEAVREHLDQAMAGRQSDG